MTKHDTKKNFGSLSCHALCMCTSLSIAYNSIKLWICSHGRIIDDKCSPIVNTRGIERRIINRLLIKLSRSLFSNAFVIYSCRSIVNFSSAYSLFVSAMNLLRGLEIEIYLVSVYSTNFNYFSSLSGATCSYIPMQWDL